MVEGPVVAVRGESVREAAPEIARFTVSVTARDRDRELTLRRLTERLSAVREVLDEFADAIERRETAGMYVYPETKRAGEKVVAYVGTVSTTVVVSDLSVVGDLMIRVADQEQTTIAGPSWGLRPDSPEYRAARRDAVTDALARANDYAEALGARVTRLVELADQGLGSRAPAGERTMPLAFGAAAAPGGPPVSIDLEPARQVVRAAVEARFVISDPTL